MLIYLNVLCIAGSAFCVGWSNVTWCKAINAVACLLNIAVVMAQIAKLHS